jgi:hypothetical protein
MTIRDERDRAMEKSILLRAEAESSNLKCHSFTQENESLRVEISSTRARTLENELRLVKMESALSEARKEAVEHALISERRASDRLSTADLTRSSELIKIRESAIAEGLQREKETTSQYEIRIAELDKKLAEVCRDRDEARDALRELSASLDEEQGEGRALRLRLGLQESQVLEYQQRLQAIEAEHQRQEAFSLGLVVGAGVDSAGAPTSVLPSPQNGLVGPDFARTYPTPYNPPYPPHRTSEGFEMGMGLSSPIFSEDFGPASMPESPMQNSFRSQNQGQGLGSKGDRYYPQNPNPNPNPSPSGRRNQFSQLQSLSYPVRRGDERGMGGSGRSDRNDDGNDEYGDQYEVPSDAVVEENERLKAVIREVRSNPNPKPS